MVVEKAVILVAAETMCQNMTEKQQVFQNLNPGESSAVFGFSAGRYCGLQCRYRR